MIQHTGGSSSSRRMFPIRTSWRLSIATFTTTTPGTKATTAAAAAAADNNTSDKQKVTSIRLYRILQRQCRQLERELQQQQQQQQQQHQSNQLILLQKPLEPRAAGSSRIYVEHRSEHASSSSPQLQQAYVWAMFYHWNVFSAVLNDRYDEDEGLFLHAWYHHIMTSVSFDYREWVTESSHWITVTALKNAIRAAFRYEWISQDKKILDKKKCVKYQHAWAIRAYQMLQEQHKMLQLTSVSQLHNVQVTATSKWIGRSLTGHPQQQQQQQQQEEEFEDEYSSSALKYRFAYRIRIENQSLTDTIQLLGRTWYIQEYNSSSNNNNNNNSSNHGELTGAGEPIHVYAPQTGAVGQLPVLHPGEAFEYVSGAELGTPQGQMKGCFHMAIVPHDTPSAVVGMPVAALEPAAESHRFEVPVRPFPLRVDPTSDYVVSSSNDE